MVLYNNICLLSSVDLEVGSEEAKMAASLSQEEEDLTGEYCITGVTTNLQDLIDSKLTELGFTNMICNAVDELDKKVKEQESEYNIQFIHYCLTRISTLVELAKIICTMFCSIASIIKAGMESLRSIWESFHMTTLAL